jgi:malonyl CoA-acyl carrier protein transacylase
MISVWVFPGQGSQFRGMGAALLDRYPRLVKEADEVLGYSIRRLIVEDPDKVLNRTEFTQPALFVTSALSFLDKCDRSSALPEFYAGHSLGEFNALFAAGGLDFQTGLALVQQRGKLMTQAPAGAMAAVVGLKHSAVREILAGSPYTGIDIANINSATQIVISGLHDEIQKCEPRFVQAGARFVHLNVSAAFHSRFMRDVQESFGKFLSTVELRALRAKVMSNYTAQPYPTTGYQDLLVQQIAHPVRWHETISWLMSRGELSLEEVGPGDVLTKLFAKIKEQPAVTPQPSMKRRIIFMYSGQGSQYYSMGKELYQQDAIFRQSMDACDRIHQALTGKSFVTQLYEEASKHHELTDTSISHPALFSVGYGLTQVLIDRKIRPDCVLGYSLGEYIAAVVAGALALEDAMAMLVEQARLLKEGAAGGAMLMVLSPVDHFERNRSLYAGCTLASVNYDQNFVVSGNHQALTAIKARLDDLSVVSSLLPVQHAFHSGAVDPIEAQFRKLAEQVPTHAPQLPMYSAARMRAVEQCDAQYLWDVIRNKVDFHGLMRQMTGEHDCHCVDLGPTGTLSSFIKYGFAGRVPHTAAMNQFGKNLQSLSNAVAELSA